MSSSPLSDPTTTSRVRRALPTALAALLLAGGVLLTYVVVVWLGSGFRLPERPATGWVLLATVIVALGSQPVFRWSRARLGARLGVRSVAPFDLLRRLPQSVTAELPMEQIPQHLAQTLGEGLRADRAELWVRVGDGHRRTAVWTAPGGRTDWRPADHGPVPHGPDRAVYPIGPRGSGTAGVLVVEHRPARALSGLERRLVRAYVAQAGQVMAMLSAQASVEARRRQLAEQRTALLQVRDQLARTRQLERRRLERDLHDGAQQDLLGLALTVHLAQRHNDTQPERATAMVQRAVEQIDRVVVDLGSLADSLYPRLLASDGLTAALTARLAALAVPTVVRERPDGGGAGLLAQVAETLYFVALEATQNAVRHAAAASILVEVTRTSGDVSVEIADRGRGFDPTTVTQHAGLMSMAERTARLGGVCRVAATPGEGTVVRATVPLAPPAGAPR